ncbi:MAG: hypothetical protein KME32_26685 [Mojavia pulchra JT2-VF2]|uniref:Uncharacterized protein n=1 Tax=Mojavia pulchra JT2-VF2 TaxID=287848 RepID=A0A951UIF1_9NOST|nr:hypothetical protein [Mojavia pulchra JT2-VF2]
MSFGAKGSDRVGLMQQLRMLSTKWLSFSNGKILVVKAEIQAGVTLEHDLFSTI